MRARSPTATRSSAPSSSGPPGRSSSRRRRSGRCRPRPASRAAARRSCPSIDSQTSLWSWTNSSRSVAPKNAILPPKRLVDAFARRATALEKPNDATLMKWRTALAAVVGAVADPPRVDRPRAAPARMWRAAAPISSGSSSVRRKSPPVPRGIRPISVGRAGAGREHAVGHLGDRPVAAQRQDQPPAGGRLAPGDLGRVARRRSVNALSSSPSPSASAPRMRAQRASERPPPERGLTIDEGRAGIHHTLPNRPTPRPVSSPRDARRHTARARRQRLLGAGQRRRRARGPDIGSIRALLWSQVPGR